MSNAVPLPEGTTIGKSFEYGMDVNLGTYAAPDWQPIRRASGFQPTPTPTTQDAQTYDDLGAQNQDVTGWSFSHAINVQVNRSLATGKYLPEVEYLLARTRPSAKGDLAVADVRWYHKPELGTPNPDDAGRGFVTVAYTRQNVGPEGAVEVFAFTLTGKGPAEEITNPFQGWGANPEPDIASVSPTGALSGELVTITGSGFLGATAVTFDTISADDFTVVSSTTIVASLPVDTASAVPVVVTTPAGVSPAFSYERGA